MQDPSPEAKPQAPKTRHGCATALLILLILASAGFVIMLFAVSEIRRGNVPFPEWSRPVLIAWGLLNIFFAVALLVWKKWGFYGIAVASILKISVELAVGMSIESFEWLIPVALLYAVLQIGGERSTWKQLRW